MKPIASSHRDGKRLPDDAAFTLTEMAASLVVVAMLVSGLGEVTRQFARTTVRVRAALEETRDVRLAQAEFARFERAEPDAATVSSTDVQAPIGGEVRRFEVSPAPGNERLLTWESEGVDAQAETGVRVDGGARFELGLDGSIRLWDLAGDPPLLVVTPRRTAAFDCRFDVVVRDCR